MQRITFKGGSVRELDDDINVLIKDGWPRWIEEGKEHLVPSTPVFEFVRSERASEPWVATI
jgi:hypothetical protein